MKVNVCKISCRIAWNLTNVTHDWPFTNDWMLIEIIQAIDVLDETYASGQWKLTFVRFHAELHETLQTLTFIGHRYQSHFIKWRSQTTHHMHCVIMSDAYTHLHKRERIHWVIMSDVPCSQHTICIGRSCPMNTHTYTHTHVNKYIGCSYPMYVAPNTYTYCF